MRKGEMQVIAVNIKVAGSMSMCECIHTYNEASIVTILMPHVKSEWKTSLDLAVDHIFMQVDPVGSGLTG
jgi:hypothetical protein